MKKFYETKLTSVFQVETLIGIGHSKRLREYRIDSPGVRDGRVGAVYDFWQLIYLQEGTYRLQIEGNPPYLLQPGQLMLCEPRKIRFSLDSSTALAGIISFRCHSPKLQKLKNRPLTLPQPEQAVLLQLLVEGSALLCRTPNDSPYRGSHPTESTKDYHLQAVKNRIELLLIGLFDRLPSQTESSPPLLPPDYTLKFRQIETYMQQNIGTTLTTEALLAASGLSLSTLKRIFRQEAGCGVIHYFLKLKINEAKRLLLETELTVSEISDRLGFSSVHHFSNLFKKYTGVSPRQYAQFGFSQQV